MVRNSDTPAFARAKDDKKATQSGSHHHPIPLLFYLNSAKMINIEAEVSRFLPYSRFHIAIHNS
jgi:hypothetical protein